MRLVCEPDRKGAILLGVVSDTMHIYILLQRSASAERVENRRGMAYTKYNLKSRTKGETAI